MNEFDFSEDYYKGLCERMSRILAKEKELKAEKETVRQEILTTSGGDRMDFGLKVSFQPGRETVDYKGMVKDLEIPEFTVNSYTKVGEGHWRITKY